MTGKAAIDAKGLRKAYVFGGAIQTAWSVGLVPVFAPLSVARYRCAVSV